ncbi:retrovirus-related pol polyprotein from transposon TNT 1-94 [Tanacetum coccineum]
MRTDRGTKFLNKKLHAYFKEEGIEHQTSIPRPPEQNGVVKRQNCTLVEAAQTMLSASKLPLFFKLKLYVHAEKNTDNQAADAHLEPYEFINPFCTPIQEVAQSSSRNVDNLNMHTFYQCHQSEHRWTKDHPLEQVRINPSKPVQTRRQLATDPETSMFALTVSTFEQSIIKEAMTDHAWIKAMQE